MYKSPTAGQMCNCRQAGYDSRRPETDWITADGDCSPPCRARPLTSQTVTVDMTDLHWSPWADYNRNRTHEILNNLPPELYRKQLENSDQDCFR